LPGATKRLGAMMAQRGLSASQPRMRADTHRGPEHNGSTSEAEYIDAALTFARSELHLAPHGRAIHSGTSATWRVVNTKSAFNPEPAIDAPATHAVKRTIRSLFGRSGYSSTTPSATATATRGFLLAELSP